MFPNVSPRLTHVGTSFLCENDNELWHHKLGLQK